jgi:putative tricarboxylic transport membrane protein
MIGAYSLNNSTFDMGIALFFGVVGYLFRVARIPIAPMVIALVIGAKAEKSLRQSLTMSGGELDIFYKSPITIVLLLLAVLVLFGPMLWRLVQRLKPAPAPREEPTR